MDPLSDVCSFLEVKDLKPGQVRLGGPWAFRYDDQSRRSVILTVASKGSFWLSVDGVDAPIHIQEGDWYVLTSPSHCMHSERETKSVPIALRSPKDIAGSLKSIEAAFPFSNEPMNTIAGAGLSLDEVKAGPFFDLLPPVIHVRADSPEAPVLRSVLSVLTYEAIKPRVGNQLMIDSLARILFVEVLRLCVAHEDSQKGWLGALVDAKIGAALAVMHRDVTKRLTVDHIATAVGMSRSSFHLWGSIIREMKASFRNATAPDLQENPLVDLIGAVFLQIGVNPYWIVGLSRSRSAKRGHNSSPMRADDAEQT